MKSGLLAGSDGIQKSFSIAVAQLDVGAATYRVEIDRLRGRTKFWGRHVVFTYCVLAVSSFG